MSLLDKVMGNNEEEKDNAQMNGDATSLMDMGVSSVEGVDDANSKNTGISKVPITDRDEAMDFALTEWNKIRRTSGHSLECKVFGSNYWQSGEWCKIYLPTLNEYTDMYITKVDHSNDSGSEWMTSLTLMDYAPSLSELEEDEVEREKQTTAEAPTTETAGNDNSIWTAVAQMLQDNYEKPDGGWDNIIRTVIDAKKYDPDIRNVLTPLKKKQGKETVSYVSIGHELCDIVGITY